MIKKLCKLVPHALVALWFAFPLVALADQAGFAPLATIPSGPLATLYTTPNNGDFSNFINSLFKFTLALGAIAAVLRIAFAGYLYMGQSDMWSHKGQAKTIIGDVTLGLLLLLGVYLILYQINPDIVKLNALKNITPVNQAPSASTQQPAVQQILSDGSRPGTNVNVNGNGTCTSYDEYGNAFTGPC
jgi:hypothetical protein